MAVYYADTSTLVKRHANEVGSVWTRAILASNTIITARISLVEVISALNKKVRLSQINTADYQSVATDFKATFFNEYQVIELAVPVYEHACLLIEKHQLRTFDSVQLASALLANNIVQVSGSTPITFLAGDNDLRAAAQTEGLLVDTPEDHP
jgi:predicted nucleic acid-binding protein